MQIDNIQHRVARTQAWSRLWQAVSVHNEAVLQEILRLGQAHHIDLSRLRPALAVAVLAHHEGIRVPVSNGPYASPPASRMPRDLVDFYPEREPYSPVFCNCGHVFLMLPDESGECPECGTLHELMEWEVVEQS